MARYAYTARDDANQARTGAIEAASRREAMRILGARGLRPVELAEAAGRVAPSRPARAALRDRLPFLQALADLVAGGLSAGEAVRLLAARLRQPRLRGLAGALWDRLCEGRTLSQAMAGHPQVFDGQTIQLVAAGEATGNLRDVLRRLIRHLTERRALRRRLLAALAYPAFVGVLACGVVLFFLFSLLPRLQALLASLGGDLPLATRILVAGADALLRYGGPALAAVALAAVAVWRWRRTAAGHAASDAWLVRVPLAGRIVVQSSLLDFTHTFAVLLENGITTAEALRLAERTVSNVALRAALRAATGRVLEGESLSTALARTGMFAPLDLDRLAIGEQTGDLAPALRAVAAASQDALDRWLHGATRFASTGALLGAFGFVAFLAYAIVSAVFEVSASFSF